MGSRTWTSTKANFSNFYTPSPAAMWEWMLDTHNTLLSIGLVVETTSLAAQWDLLIPSSVPAAKVYTLFRIYEINDSLSGALPIYVKLWFGGHQQQGGTYESHAHQPQCKVQIGTAVAPDGTLSGLVSEAFSVMDGTGASQGGSFSTVSTQNYFHKSDIGLFLYLGGSPGFAGVTTLLSPALMFYLERLPDAAGNPTPAGYTIVKPATVTSVNAAGDANGGPSRSPTARTFTPAFDLGAWHTTVCAPLGGSVTATVEGGINFHPFYHICPELRPMRGIFAYYTGVMTTLSNASLVAPGGAEIQVKALGGSSTGYSGYGMACDQFDYSFLLAAVTD